MSRRIKVNIPLNLDKNDFGDFKNLRYNLSRSRVLKLKDIIITYDGLCLSDYKLVKESTYGYRDKITIYTLTSKLSLLNNKTYILRTPDPFLLIFGPIFSFYHWITESIPRLLLASFQLKTLTLLLPVSFKNIDFVRESLKPFKDYKIVYLPRNANVYVKNLILPQLKPFFTSYNPEMVNKIREIYHNYSTNLRNTINYSNSKIFLSDEIKGKAKIQNLIEVKLILKKYGIYYLNILNNSFLELINYISNTKIIISATGDDLACINFMKSGSSVFELLMRSPNEIDSSDFKYLYLASGLCLKYYYQYCTSQKNGSEINIELELFEKNVKLMLSD